MYMYILVLMTSDSMYSYPHHQMSIDCIVHIDQHNWLMTSLLLHPICFHDK